MTDIIVGENPVELDYKKSAARKIKHATGRYYLLILNIDEQRRFNGLPGEDSKIVVLDDNVRKNAENKVDGFEMVFEVFSVGDECDYVYDEGKRIKLDPIVNVGDIVLAKGNVFKIHTEPVIYAATRENIVAIIKNAEDR
ncbi:MAG: hypothetical protein R3309_01695 [Reinekea sp.]|nr:hypothetical protein [Reinekea sp.]